MWSLLSFLMYEKNKKGDDTMYEQFNNGLNVYLPQEVDHYTAEEIRREVDKRIEKGGVSLVTFDFRNTSFMDSSGIGLIMGRYKMVNYIGGSVCVVNVSDKIDRLLKLARVQQFVQIFKS